MPRVLIVDDSPVIRSAIKIYLQPVGCDVVDAATGERALQILRLVSIQLVIADISMPGMTGLGLLRAIRADERPEIARLHVILLTGERAESLEAKALEAGATAFLRKPVSSNGLVDRVRTLLGATSP